MSTHKIELRSIRINEKLSRETTCFAARLYVDGVLTATAGNAGNGGPVVFPDRFDKMLFVLAQLEAQSRPATRAFGANIPTTLEMVVFGLVEDERQRQFVAREPFPTAAALFDAFGHRGIVAEPRAAVAFHVRHARALKAAPAAVEAEAGNLVSAHYRRHQRWHVAPE